MRDKEILYYVYVNINHVFSGAKKLIRVDKYCKVLKKQQSNPYSSFSKVSFIAYGQLHS